MTDTWKSESEGFPPGLSVDVWIWHFAREASTATFEPTDTPRYVLGHLIEGWHTADRLYRHEISRPGCGLSPEALTTVQALGIRGYEALLLANERDGWNRHWG